LWQEPENPAGVRHLPAAQWRQPPGHPNTPTSRSATTRASRWTTRRA